MRHSAPDVEPASLDAALLEEALVVPHDQVRLELAHRVERDADRDQQRGAAEEEGDVELALHDVGHDRDRGHEQRAAEGDALEDPLDVLGGGLAGADAGDEAAGLLHVFSQVDGIYGYRVVEVAEEDDEARVHRVVDVVAALEEAHHALARGGVGHEGRDRDGDRQQGQREDDRDDAALVDLERKVALGAAVHLAADHALRVLDGDLALGGLHPDDDDDDRRERRDDPQPVAFEHHVEIEEVAPQAAIEDRVQLGREDGRDIEVPVFDVRREAREDERDWEGAIERLMRNFGLSLLVPDRHYARVAEWVDRTHLKGRLVYFRVREGGRFELSSLHSDTLACKVAIKPDSPYYNWLEREIAHRFDVACCDTQEQFRRENRAITRAGQIKAPGERHEKDDRYRLDDRSRYVLGWSNTAKIAALEEKSLALESLLSETGSRISALQNEQRSLKVRLDTLSKLGEYSDFRELDWRLLALDVAKLVDEKRQMEAASDLLKALSESLNSVKTDLKKTEDRLKTENDKRAKTEQKISDSETLRQQARSLLDAATLSQAGYFERLAALRHEAPDEDQLTVETCDPREQDLARIALPIRCNFSIHDWPPTSAPGS